MKKKLLALAMALFLVLGASACSEQTGTQASPSQTGLSPTQTADSGEAGNSAAATLPPRMTRILGMKRWIKTAIRAMMFHP